MPLNRVYCLCTATILGMVAALHLFRVLTQTPVMAGSWEFPMWLSMVGVVGAGAFSLWGFVLAFRRP